MFSARQMEEPRQTIDLAGSDSNYFQSSEVRFIDRGITVHLTLGDRVSWRNVRLVSLFPLSCPYEYISISDSEGVEIGVVRALGELDADSQRIAVLRLQYRYLLPVVQRILSVKERFGSLKWEIETDCGRRSFVTKNTRETTVRLSTNRLLLCDIDGNRYEIRDLTGLDASSRAYLSRCL